MPYKNKKHKDTKPKKRHYIVGTITFEPGEYENIAINNIKYIDKIKSNYKLKVTVYKEGK